MPLVYYNEIDPFCCAWLEELMTAGLIPAGWIDDRSIQDVRPEELQNYTQCHFFAGIGGWAAALRYAGWGGERPVWTGSCPCQPFSAAGKGGGFTDERHLWPAFFHLIEAVRPVSVLGEQVSSKDGLAWLDLVQTDLEGAGYAVGAIDSCSAGVGAPHIRQRLYWMAHAADARRDYAWEHDGRSSSHATRSEQCSVNDGLADSCQQGQSGRGIQRPGESDSAGVGSACERSAGLCATSGLALPDGGNSSTEGLQRSGEYGQQSEDGGASNGLGNPSNTRLSIRECETVVGAGRGEEGGTAQQPSSTSDESERLYPTNGLWSNPDWLLCRDAKWRPVESSTFPLARAGTYRNRVATLRGAGNAINLAQAAEFIGAVMEELGV